MKVRQLKKNRDYFYQKWLQSENSNYETKYLLYLFVLFIMLVILTVVFLYNPKIKEIQCCAIINQVGINK